MALGGCCIIYSPSKCLNIATTASLMLFITKLPSATYWAFSSVFLLIVLKIFCFPCTFYFLCVWGTLSVSCTERKKKKKHAEIFSRTQHVERRQAVNVSLARHTLSAQGEITQEFKSLNKYSWYIVTSCYKTSLVRRTSRWETDVKEDNAAFCSFTSRRWLEEGFMYFIFLFFYFFIIAHRMMLDYDKMQLLFQDFVCQE